MGSAVTATIGVVTAVVGRWTGNHRTNMNFYYRSVLW